MHDQHWRILKKKKKKWQGSRPAGSFIFIPDLIHWFVNLKYLFQDNDWSPRGINDFKMWRLLLPTFPSGKKKKKKVKGSWIRWLVDSEYDIWITSTSEKNISEFCLKKCGREICNHTALVCIEWSTVLSWSRLVFHNKHQQSLATAYALIHPDVQVQLVCRILSWKTFLFKIHVWI